MYFILSTLAGDYISPKTEAIPSTYDMFSE